MSSSGSAYFNRFTAVLESTIPAANNQILEVGGASATALKSFLRRRRDSRSVVLELSSYALHIMRQGGPPCPQRVVGDALELPFAARSFDAVVCFQVIEHLPDVAAALEEMLRVLRRPGYLVIGVPNHASLWTPLGDAFWGRNRLAFGIENRWGCVPLVVEEPPYRYSEAHVPLQWLPVSVTTARFRVRRRSRCRLLCISSRFWCAILESEARNWLGVGLRFGSEGLGR